MTLTLRLVFSVAMAALVSCSTVAPVPDGDPASSAGPARAADGRASARVATAAASIEQAASSATAAGTAETVQLPTPSRSQTVRGTGVLVGEPQRLPAGARPSGGGISLNFEGADLREVVRSLLGDTLKQSYVVDPQVAGTVTIRTSSPIPADAVLPTLETLLRMNGHTLVREGELYKVVPAAAAVRGNVTPQLGHSTRPLPQGFSVRIVPLRFVGVRDMLRLLEPFAKDAAAVRIDEVRNLMILSGTERELGHLVETIGMFDVDWMAGMSVGLFTLVNSDVKQVINEINQIFGDRIQGPLAGVLRIIPIERINGILVITPQPKYLDDARVWIQRLDSESRAGQRLFVYHMQNGRADKLAPLLMQAFTGRAPQQQMPTGPQLAPGETPAMLTTGAGVTPVFQPQTGIATPPGSTVIQPGPAGQPMATPTVPPGQRDAARPSERASVAPAAVGPGGAITPLAPLGVPAAPRVAGAPAAGGADPGSAVVRDVQIVADKDNNALLIVATQAEYAVIEAAIRKLDIAPRQVMIEVSIVEVLLRDEFRFGIEWFFSAGANVRGLQSSAAFGTASNLFTGANSPFGAGSGFTVALQNAAFPGGIQAALNTLAGNSKTKIVSNPHILATDNQKATIKVGDKIPIEVNTVVPGTTTSTIATTSQYLETGILLTVTPKINAGGLVTLDLSAEVSDPGARSTTNAPPINTRSAQTIVTVQSGETMVLAGLIRDNKGTTSDGIPFLSQLPVVGVLFGTQAQDANRTELAFFITPRVVSGEADMRAVAEELRKKMERLGDAFPPALAAPPAPATN